MTPRFFSLLLLLLVIPTVSAVGFSGFPNEREYIFEPGMSITVPLNAIKGNNIKAWVTTMDEQHPETLGTPMDDNILSYARLDDPAPGTGPREIVLHLDLPQQLKPGIHTVDVMVGDYPPGAGNAMVSAVAVTSLRFTIRVLTDEPLVDITYFGVMPSAEGTQANATLAIASRTKQDLTGIQTQFTVFNGTTPVATGRTAPIALKSGEAAVVSTLLSTQDLAGGEYPVNVTVTYADKEARGGPATLLVGTLHVSIPSHTQELTYNTTNRFLFTIGNEWNRELQEVYAVVDIGSQTKKTASQNVPPFGQTEYELYFDREEQLLPGPTEANVTVTFEDFDPKSGKYVNKEESFLLPLAVVLPPEPPKEKMNTTLIVTFTIIGLLLILLIVAIIILLRRPRAAQPAPSQPVQPPPTTPDQQK